MDMYIYSFRLKFYHGKILRASSLTSTGRLLKQEQDLHKLYTELL